jgi:hypothetical protein
MQWFFEAVPPSGLDDALQSSGDERFDRLYDALHDDAYRKTSFAALCRRAGLSLYDLMDLWRSYNCCLGLIAMATHLPDVMEDIGLDSLSRNEQCPRCDGSATVTDGTTERYCPACQGVGTVRVPGDPNASRLMFEILGLIAPRRGRRAAT